MNYNYLELIKFLNEKVKTNNKPFKLSTALRNTSFTNYDLLMMIEYLKGNFVESKDISGYEEPQFYFVPLDIPFKIKNVGRGYVKVLDYMVIQER